MIDGLVAFHDAYTFLSKIVTHFKMSIFFLKLMYFFHHFKEVQFI